MNIINLRACAVPFHYYVGSNRADYYFWKSIPGRVMVISEYDDFMMQEIWFVRREYVTGALFDF